MTIFFNNSTSKALILLTLFSILFYSRPAFSDSHVLIMQIQDSQPKYFLNSRKNPGICSDIYHELQSRLAKKDISIFIPGTYTPIKRILQKLTTGSAHVFCGAGRNAEREKKFYYSKMPLYSVSHVLMAHKNEKVSPKSFNDLIETQATVGVYFGTSTSQFIKKYEALNINDGFYDLERALLAISNKKLRYFYYHDLALNYYLRNTSLPLKVLPYKYRTYSHWMIYSKFIPKKIRALIDNEITDMVKSGLINQIRAKYEPN